MRFFTFLFISTTLLLASCDALKSKTKETINQGGEIAGEAASEFVEGFSDGIDESFDQKIILSDELKKKGIEFGAFSIKNGAEGIDNLLSIYLIFNQDFTHTISSKAFNESDVEIGRSTLDVKGKRGEANYFEFTFNKETRIEGKGKITLEL